MQLQITCTVAGVLLQIYLYGKYNVPKVILYTLMPLVRVRVLYYAAFSIMLDSFLLGIFSHFGKLKQP